MKTLDLIFFGLKGKINGAKALKELESLGVIKGNKIVYDDNDKMHLVQLILFASN